MDAKELIRIGIENTQDKKFQNAIEAFSKAIEIDPNSYDGYLERSKVKELIKDDKGAKTDRNIAIVLIEKLDAGLKAFDEGIAKYEVDDYNSAIDFFTKSTLLIDISDKKKEKNFLFDNNIF